MKSNGAALSRVASKINHLHLQGYDFSAVLLWKFDWDEVLSVTENFKNAGDEEAALVTLGQVGAIHTYYKENFLRDEHEDSMARHGKPMNLGWETAPISWRLYDYLRYVDSFDYEKFVLFCSTHGIDLNSNQIVGSAEDIVAAPNEDVTARGATTQMNRKSDERRASIYLMNMTLKLSFGGDTVTLKKFNSKTGFNFHLLRKLLDSQGSWIGKIDVGAKANKIMSPVKDWPKQMGFGGEMKDIFISIDKKQQKIRLDSKKSLTADEAEIIKSLVNTQNP